MTKMRKQNRDRVLKRFLDGLHRELFQYVLNETSIEGKKYTVYTDGHLLGHIPTDWAKDTAIARDIKNTPHKFPDYMQIVPDPKEIATNTSKCKFEYVDIVRKDKENKYNMICFDFSDGIKRAYNADFLYHVMLMTQREELTLEVEYGANNKAALIISNGAYFVLAPLLPRVIEKYPEYAGTYHTYTVTPKKAG